MQMEPPLGAERDSGWLTPKSVFGLHFSELPGGERERDFEPLGEMRKITPDLLAPSPTGWVRH